jgi:hypothetical protein
MVTTKAGRQKENPKSSFSRRALQDLVKKINRDPRLLEKDWRAIVRSHFRLTPDEEKSLTGTPSAKVEKIQKFLRELAQNIREGGTATGALVKRTRKEQEEGLVYDVDIDFVAAGKRVGPKR